MVHVKSVFIGLIEMIVHRTLSKHGKDTMMLSQEHIAEHFFALELFLLHRLLLIAELGHNAVNEIEIHWVFSSVLSVINQLSGRFMLTFWWRLTTRRLSDWVRCEHCQLCRWCTDKANNRDCACWRCRKDSTCRFVSCHLLRALPPLSHCRPATGASGWFCRLVRGAIGMPKRMLHPRWRVVGKRQSESFDRTLGANGRKRKVKKVLQQKKTEENREKRYRVRWGRERIYSSRAAVNVKWSWMKCESRRVRKLRGTNPHTDESTLSQLALSIHRTFQYINVRKVFRSFSVLETFSIMNEWVLKWSGIQLRCTSHCPHIDFHWIEIARENPSISRSSQSFPYDIAHRMDVEMQHQKEFLFCLNLRNLKNVKVNGLRVSEFDLRFNSKIPAFFALCCSHSGYHPSSLILSHIISSHTHLIAESFLREISEHVVSSIIFYHRCHHHHDYYYHRSSQRHLCTGSCTSHLPNNKLKWRL